LTQKKEVFNLWLILPYSTEIILNIVIFYYNFVKELVSQEDEEDKSADAGIPMLHTVEVQPNAYH
jgi:hypothetical protein